MKIEYSFSKEYFLTQHFQEAIPGVIPNHKNRRYILVREVDTKRGLVDIICAFFLDNKIDRSKSLILEKALSDITKVHIISRLSKSTGYDANYLHQVTGLGKSTIRKHIIELIDFGLIDKTSNGSMKLSKLFSLPKITLWAFEVKLNNWKRAFYQAVHYRGCAHYVAIVMPFENLTSLPEKVKTLKQMNIGLISINQKGKVEVLHKPKKGKPISKVSHYHCLGAILAEYNKLDFQSIPDLPPKK